MRRNFFKIVFRVLCWFVCDVFDEVENFIFILSLRVGLGNENIIKIDMCGLESLDEDIWFLFIFN